MEWAFWLLVIAMIVYEIVSLYFTSDPDDHITAIFRRLSRRPLIPFAMGFLMGHLFWCN